jgi:hypothetical protein
VCAIQKQRNQSGSRRWIQGFRGKIAQVRTPVGLACLLVAVALGVNEACLAQDVTPLNQATAEKVQPYATLACVVYGSCGQTTAASVGYVPYSLSSWQQVMALTNVPPPIQSLISQSGFNAQIYVNNQTHDVAVSFEGTTGNIVPALVATELEKVLPTFYPAGSGTDSSWYTDLQARLQNTPNSQLLTQYVAARILASNLQSYLSKTSPGYSLSLTGQSLGGTLASYAGQYVNANVYTIEPARNVLAGTGANSRQINIIVAGDPVSDPKAPAANLAGSTKYLPGKTYQVSLPPLPTVPAAPDLRVRHSPEVALSLIQQTAGAGGQTTPSAKIAPIGTPTVIATPTPIGGPAGQATPTSTAPATHVQAAPGGISLSKAAAERLALNLSLNGAYIDSSRIILSGRNDANGRLDAALFLTGLRAACENDDPYFSLDPDDVPTWLVETRQAESDFSEVIKRDNAWHFRKHYDKDAPSILQFRTISGSRDYSELWHSLLAKYPDMKSRLVFHPEWLRQTRFGEIMYKADVLLKELAGGATALGESKFRAANIDGYRSANEYMAGRTLLYQYNGWPEQQPQRGGRIWYDLTESSDTTVAKEEAIPEGNSELRSWLQRRGLLATASARSQSPPQRLVESGSAIDLSNIYPQMFVRVRDPVTLRDGTSSFPGLDELVTKANRIPDQYATAYAEYEQLIEVFRAYLVAVRAKQLQPGVCRNLPRELLDSEKVDTALPAYHPTNFTITMAWYEYTDGRVRRAIGSSGGLFQGGVSIGAARLLEKMGRSLEISPLISELNAQAAKPINEFTWHDDHGLQFVALTFDESGASQHAQPEKYAEFRSPTIPTTTGPHLSNSPNKTSGRVDNINPMLMLFCFTAVGLFMSIPFLRPLLSKVLSSNKIAFAGTGASRQPEAPATQSRSTSSRQATNDSYDAIEREFKNVFALQSMSDREHMIRQWLSVHGGSREGAMQRLVENWRKDNRSWR